MVNVQPPCERAQTLTRHAVASRNFDRIFGFSDLIHSQIRGVAGASCAVEDSKNHLFASSLLAVTKLCPVFEALEKKQEFSR